MDGLEGCPVFLPLGSVRRAEFVEVLERLASGQRHGTGCAGGRIESPMEEGRELEPELKRTELPVGMEGGPFKERGGSGSGSFV